MSLTAGRLDEIASKFENHRVAVIGDLFLDRYLDLVPDVREMSIETGLEAYQIEQIRNIPGAVGTLINNLLALDVGRVIPVTVIGEDGHGKDLLDALDHSRVDQRFVFKEPGRQTPAYIKPMRRDSSAKQVELNRLDVRTRQPISTESQHRLREAIVEIAKECDGILVLDQIAALDEGVICRSVRESLAQVCKQNPQLPMLVDSRNRLDAFGFGSIKGNQSEFELAYGGSERSALDCVRSAANATDRTAFMTMGEKGISVVDPGAEPKHVPGIPVEGPIDIVGAGDSASSGIILSLLSGATTVEAAMVGNLVASITVQQIGTTGTASIEQLKQRLAAFC